MSQILTYSLFFGSSVKYVYAFRIALTKQPRLLTKQKYG